MALFSRPMDQVLGDLGGGIREMGYGVGNQIAAGPMQALSNQLLLRQIRQQNEQQQWYREYLKGLQEDLLSRARERDLQTKLRQAQMKADQAATPGDKKKTSTDTPAPTQAPAPLGPQVEPEPSGPGLPPMFPTPPGQQLYGPPKTPLGPDIPGGPQTGAWSAVGPRGLSPAWETLLRKGTSDFTDAATRKRLHMQRVMNALRGQRGQSVYGGYPQLGPEPAGPFI